MARNDPYQGFRFVVDIDGLTAAGFSKVKGIVRETRVETYREGGRNDHEIKLVGQGAFGNITLERGLFSPDLWSWHDDVVNGTVQRRNLTLRLRDALGTDVWRFHVDGALPVKWTLGDFDAASGQVSVESLELAHHGFRKS